MDWTGSEPYHLWHKGGNREWGTCNLHVRHFIYFSITKGRRVLMPARFEVDVSVQATNTEIVDGAPNVPVLLAPPLVDEITSTIQQACGKRRKRDTACLLDLRNPVSQIIEKHMDKAAIAALGGDSALIAISGAVLYDFDISGKIPNAVSEFGGFLPVNLYL